MNLKEIKCQQQWLAFLMLALFSVAAVADAPVPDIPKAIKGEQCVEDTTLMRRNHMELLKHQRDKTMRKGIRTKKHSLKQCFSCHVVKDANNKPVTVKNPKHFCRGCHDYTAVNIDCFQCHISTPGNEEPSKDKTRGRL